ARFVYRRERRLQRDAPLGRHSKRAHSPTCRPSSAPPTPPFAATKLPAGPQCHVHQPRKTAAATPPTSDQALAPLDVPTDPRRSSPCAKHRDAEITDRPVSKQSLTHPQRKGLRRVRATAVAGAEVQRVGADSGRRTAQYAGLGIEGHTGRQ